MINVLNLIEFFFFGGMWSNILKKVQDALGLSSSEIQIQLVVVDNNTL